MDKAYIDSQYNLAYLDFKCAHNEDEQFKARKTMAKLESLSVELFGFDFADELHEKYILSEV